MRTRLKAGVVGAGVFGGHHAAKLAAFDDVELAAVFDPHPERARALAERYGGSSASSIEALLAAVDVVSIASPATTHADLTLAALRAGKAVYVEKPLAVTLAEADQIIGEADRRGLVVACGFLERAAVQAMGLFDVLGDPLRIEAVRHGPPSPRNRDVSVVLDLMIHDLDLALALNGGEPFAVEAEGSADCDEVRAEVSFDNGLVASFDVSRSAREPARSWRILYSSGEVSFDLRTGELRNSTPFSLNAHFAETAEARDRLATSLRAFLDAVRDGSKRPLAGGVDGARALDLALAVEHAVIAKP